jgi:hypothetical protein
MTLSISLADEEERRALVSLAIGRIFRLASRPAQEGDVDAYEEARRVVLDLVEVPSDVRPNIARDRGKGAAGQW